MLLREVASRRRRGRCWIWLRMGTVSLALAFASPKADVWAVDVNERALDLTRANAKSNAASTSMPRRRSRCRPI